MLWICQRLQVERVRYAKDELTQCCVCALCYSEMNYSSEHIEQIKYLIICACSHSHVSEAYMNYTWVSQDHGEAVTDPEKERETVRQREKARVKCSQSLSISIVQTGGKPRQTRLIEKHRLTPAPSFVYLPIECCETLREAASLISIKWLRQPTSPKPESTQQP